MNVAAQRRQLHASRLLPRLLDLLPENSLALFEAARQRAIVHDLPLYLVGGPVRDALLGAPVKDLDFVLVGDATALARRLAEELVGQALIHSRFGTATVSVGEGRFDLVTARREVYPRPGALPQVTPGDMRDDLARRDFTINALALPLADPEPVLLDPHNGQADLERGLIRILHPASFVDDPTRLLRAVRYEQRLGFRLEDATLEQVKAAVAQGCLSAVSGDRLRHELARILEEGQPHLALRRAIELGVLPAIHPALSNAAAVSRLAEAPLAHPLEHLAALVWSASLAEGAAVCRRLSLPSAWAEVVNGAVALSQQAQALSAPGLAPAEACQALDGVAPAALAAATRLLEPPLARQRVSLYLEQWRHRRPSLNGRDLLALGVPPGPAVGRLLRRLRDARRNGQVNSEEEERELIRQAIAADGG